MDNEAHNRYFPYLSEVRKRVFFTVSVFFISCILGFVYYEKIISFALNIFRFQGVNYVFTSPFQFLDLSVNTAIVVGLVITFPLFLWQLISFIRPALTPREFKMIIYGLPISFVLFFAGFGFGLLIMKSVIELFYQKSIELSLGNLLDVSKILSQTLLTGVLMGIAFQFPIVLSLLIQLKILKRSILEKNRVMAYMVSIVFAALMPPTDILSLILLTLPLVILFELTLVLNRFLGKRK